jgi:hypothetical protein
MKKNLTLVIPEELLRKARVQAVHEGTSVNEIVRNLLEDYVGKSDRLGVAVEELIRIARDSKGEMGKRTWTREDLYDRKVLRGR